MYQVKILKLAIEQENQNTSQKRQLHDFLIENTQKKPQSIEKFYINRTSIGLEKIHSIFTNENLTPTKKKIEFHWELKRNGRIDKTQSRAGIVQIVSKDIENGKEIKIMHVKS